MTAQIVPGVSCQEEGSHVVTRNPWDIPSQGVDETHHSLELPTLECIKRYANGVGGGAEIDLIETQPPIR